MKRFATPILVVGCFCLQACGSNPPTQTATTVTLTVPGTTVTVSTPPVDTPTMTDSLPNETPGEPGGPTETSPVITGTVTEPKGLTLSDVFEKTGWEEGSVAIPKKSGFVSGVFTPVGGCGGSANPLEFRFADQGGQLVLNAAQGLKSKSSAAVLEFKLIADGRLVDTKVVKFNSQEVLKANLRGVSAVVLNIQDQSSECGGGSIAVLTSLQIQP